MEEQHRQSELVGDGDVDIARFGSDDADSRTPPSSLGGLPVGERLHDGIGARGRALVGTSIVGNCPTAGGWGGCDMALVGVGMRRIFVSMCSVTDDSPKYGESRD